MNINAQQVHVWQTNLIISDEEEQHNLQLLSQDEIECALRFHFPIHRRRYIASRGMLRQLLALYLDMKPKDLTFAYNKHRKPSIEREHALRFNLSHSHDLAIYAITLENEVGIDIEKVADTYNTAVARRYFSAVENAALQQFPDKKIGFYRIWTRKEALIKADGNGLTIPLSSFSVPVSELCGKIYFDNARWMMMSLDRYPNYQAAVVTRQAFDSIEYWQLINSRPVRLHQQLPI